VTNCYDTQVQKMAYIETAPLTYIKNEHYANSVKVRSKGALG